MDDLASHAASLTTDVSVECPFCGEPNALVLDPSSRGRWVQDCEVCCRPWDVELDWDRDGLPHLRVEAQ